MINLKNGTDTTTADINRYYRFHAHIYDATRWSFLFGRKSLIKNLPDLPPQPNIVEVGCGTGSNLIHLRRRFSQAQITGIDSSRSMLSKAETKLHNYQKTRLTFGNYGTDEISLPPCDLILLSYSLTIKNNQPKHLLESIKKNLKSGSYIAIVDFHATPFKFFQRWMYINNVCMDGNLLPLIHNYFDTVQSHVAQAYFGLWSNFHYIGRKTNDN